MFNFMHNYVVHSHAIFSMWPPWTNTWWLRLNDNSLASGSNCIKSLQYINYIYKLQVLILTISTAQQNIHNKSQNTNGHNRFSPPHFLWLSIILYDQKKIYVVWVLYYYVKARFYIWMLTMMTYAIYKWIHITMLD